MDENVLNSVKDEDHSSSHHQLYQEDGGGVVPLSSSAADVLVKEENNSSGEDDTNNNNKPDGTITARNNDADACSDLTDNNNENDEQTPKSFPQKLMDILSDDTLTDTISWLPHGTGFQIHKKKTFAAEILPHYFKASKFTSFTRKLNRWGFTRVPRGPETGAYFHKLFRRDKPELCLQMTSNSGNKYSSNPMQQSLLPNMSGAGAMMPGHAGMPPTMFNPFVMNPMMAASMTPQQQQMQMAWQQQMQMMMYQQQQQMMQMQQQQQQQVAAGILPPQPSLMSRVMGETDMSPFLGGVKDDEDNMPHVGSVSGDDPKTDDGEEI